ncbi:MAG: exodeoxyribonuclease VII large subunit [Bacilli bacterium]|nr:exodeoxyribonuclease VII large subunit [Bacilli bacterium]
MKVSEANLLIKKNLESIYDLRNLFIEGEITNAKEYSSGIYFNIIETDEENNIKSTIHSICWKKNFFSNNNINYQIIKNGNKICATGRIEVYAARGTYSLIISKIDLAGEGERLLALEKLKRKLEQNGLFKHKRDINIFPNAIGIITGKDSAAYRDIVFNINRRYPITKIYFFPAIVQGENATKSLINALKKSYTYKLDTIIIGRGGGGIEDLDAFNDETVARVAFESPFPIISAVGHEINKSIIDFVADKYASTPTAAAELATQNKSDILKYLDENYEKIKLLFSNKFNLLTEKIKNYENYFSLKNIRNIFENKIQKLELYKKELKNAIKIFFLDRKNILKLKQEQLSQLNIENVLKRGFTFVRNKQKKLITKSSETKINEQLEINFYKSSISVNVIKKD